MVTSSNMVTLRTSFTALARLTASKLLEFSVKLFDLPTYIVLLTNDVRCRFVWASTVCNHPFNVTVCGDYLEQLHQERERFELDCDTFSQLCLRPLDLLKMNIPALFAQA